jgi:DNA-binding transcriptional LysR family regulator
VGRHVDALEHAIGTQLFTRSPTGLIPTEVAIELKPYAAALAATSASLLRTASGARDAIAGTVRVSASEVIATEVLPAILAELQDAHPALRVEVSASDTIEDLLHREADVAVRMAAPAQDALIVRRVGDLAIGLFAHARYVERHGAPKTVADLARIA